MGKSDTLNLAGILNQHESEILKNWMALQLKATSRRADLISDSDLQAQSKEFLATFRQALASGGDDTTGPEWKAVREMLGEISSSRARQGFTPSETATFIFSLKQPLFRSLQGDQEGANGAVRGALEDHQSAGSTRPAEHRDLSEEPRIRDQPAAAGVAGALHAGGQTVGGHIWPCR